MVDYRVNFRGKPQASAAKLILRRIHRRHLSWGGVAVVISLVFHLVLLAFFPGFTLYGLGRERVPDKPRQTPLTLKEVTLQPERMDPEKRPPRFRPEEVRGSSAGEVSSEAVALRRDMDQAAVEPRPLDAGILIGEQRSLAEPAPEDRPLWEPREEIIGINKKIVPDEIAALPRRFISAIPRLSGAPDIVVPADRDSLTRGLVSTGAYYLVDDPSQFLWGRPVSGGGGGGGSSRPVNDVLRDESRKLVETARDREAILKALEKYLKAVIYVYRTPADPLYAYCRIEIQRRTDEVLPVLSKDVLLVQDASASITEQKLHFCREGMIRALDLLGPDDRFNVVEFRDKVARCFPEWAPVNPDTLTQGRAFIMQMQSVGNTDLFGSLKELLELPRKPGRPVIMEVVSDGVATVGLTDRSAIIEAFSRENKGALSVFTLGTYPGANAYLLDLLSYRNRGDTFVVKTGRWDIPAALERRVREVSRPVLSDVRFRFSGQTYCEAYPTLTSNLYLDRPLVVFGRYSVKARRLVFQATGRADDIECDMVFDIDLSKAMDGDKDIRTNWGWQKAYHLIGQHQSAKQPAVLINLRQIGRDFGLIVPYLDELAE
jgi:hypothetical protein